MTIGYNLAELGARLNYVFETEYIDIGVQAKDKRMADLTQKMRIIEALLSKASVATEKDEKFSCKDDPALMDLVDMVRQIGEEEDVLYNGLPGVPRNHITLIDPGCYEWDGRELQIMMDRLNGFIGRSIQPQLTQCQTELAHLGQMQSQAVEIFSRTVKHCNDHIQKILHNTNQR